MLLYCRRVCIDLSSSSTHSSGRPIQRHASGNQQTAQNSVRIIRHVARLRFAAAARAAAAVGRAAAAAAAAAAANARFSPRASALVVRSLARALAEHLLQKRGAAGGHRDGSGTGGEASARRRAQSSNSSRDCRGRGPGRHKSRAAANDGGLVRERRPGEDERAQERLRLRQGQGQGRLPQAKGGERALCMQLSHTSSTPRPSSTIHIPAFTRPPRRSCSRSGARSLGTPAAQSVSRWNLASECSRQRAERSASEWQWSLGDEPTVGWTAVHSPEPELCVYDRSLSLSLSLPTPFVSRPR